MNNPTPFHDFLLQVLEAEESTVGAYDAAIPQATSDELREEWRNGRASVARHHRRLEEELQLLHIEPGQGTEGRDLVHSYGVSFIRTIIVGSSASRDAAEMCAAQSLSDLNARCCLNWELLDSFVTKHRLGVPASLHTLVREVVDDKRDLCEVGTDALRRMWDKRLGLSSGVQPDAAAMSRDGAPETGTSGALA